MKKAQIIQKSYEFSDIINRKQCYKNLYYLVFLIKNNTNNAHFGISIPKKITIAVKRNKLKRQIKSIIDINIHQINQCYDYVIIARHAVLNLTYQEQELSLLSLFNQIKETTIHEKK